MGAPDRVLQVGWTRHVPHDARSCAKLLGSSPCIAAKLAQSPESTEFDAVELLAAPRPCCYGPSAACRRPSPPFLLPFFSKQNGIPDGLRTLGQNGLKTA